MVKVCDWGIDGVMTAGKSEDGVVFQAADRGHPRNNTRSMHDGGPL
jgi:gluconate kinase